MLERVNPTLMVAIKKYAYLLFIVPLILPYLSYLAAEAWGWKNFFAFGTVIFIFVLVPILDHLIGQDPANPDEEREVPKLSKDLYYRLLTLSCVPAYLFLILWGADMFMNYGFNWVGKLGWLLSIGTVGGLAITVAHELIHKDEKLEQWAGGLLLSMVTYGGFKVEHVRGHHVHVSTPEDASSARFNQSLYEFLPHAYRNNFLNAWKLEKERLARKGLPLFHWRNELIWWYIISLGFTLGFFALWGIWGAVFFLAQSYFAFTLLEIVNYLEHYGLHRRKLPNGRYERTLPEHSWNSNYFLTNIFLFHLQRHSDHHAFAKRRYQVLRHQDTAPQLPSGYATMVVLALIPPLWKRIMNPRVLAYYKGEEHQLV